ncbi:MAG TPA: deoxyribonuclease IV, partial [Gemmatimonadales bacterium]|nr:deoxyribonuclease IV [Gemmatimonadales bacterium]
MASRHFIGAHVNDEGGIEMAARRAGRARMGALQVFTAPPRFYGDRAGVRPERAQRFRAAVDAAGLDRRRVMAHGAYVLNVATAEAEKWGRAAAGLAKELERSTTLGLGGVCFHPGSAGKGGDRWEAVARVAEAMTRALESVAGETMLWIENTAGAGATVGREPAEVGGMLAALPSHLRGRAGYGLDTCHLFSAGYDISESKAKLTAVLDAFQEATGEPPRFFHLNDSQGALGSNVDRHALIGEGRIGVDAFRWLLEDERSRDVPLILETPQERSDVPEE